MMPTTPSGWCSTRARPGRNHIDGDRCGFIQPAKVRARVAHRLQAGKEFQQAGLVRRAVAEVGGNGLDEALAVVVHQIEQGIEPRLPRRHAQPTALRRVAACMASNWRRKRALVGRCSRCCWIAVRWRSFQVSSWMGTGYFQFIRRYGPD
jgi:hypothetical protein